MAVHYKRIADYLRLHYFYDREIGQIRNIHDRSIATRQWRGHKVLRLYRRNLYSQHVAWLLHFGEWPSNFVCRLDNNEENDSITNLVQISDIVKEEHPSFMRGYSVDRRGGFETYYLMSIGPTEERKYLGMFYTKQDAEYRVYTYNAERKRQNRSVFANIERHRRACV